MFTTAKLETFSLTTITGDDLRTGLDRVRHIKSQKKNPGQTWLERRPLLLLPRHLCFVKLMLTMRKFASDMPNNCMNLPRNSGGNIPTQYLKQLYLTRKGPVGNIMRLGCKKKLFVAPGQVMVMN